MKTSQVIISGCWCCVCFPFCLESLRRVEHSCPRFSFFSIVFSMLLFCSRLQNFCCRFLFVCYCLCCAVGWQSASLEDAKRPCLSSISFVKLLIDCFFPELNILDRVADVERPCTSTMGAFDSGTPMNNGRTEGSTSTDDLKSNLWNIHITKKNLLFTNYRRAKLLWHQQCTIG